MKKAASSVSFIGGEDGPTSFFILGKDKNKKLPLKQRLHQKYLQDRYNRRRKKAEASIVANPHTLDEVVCYMKNAYDAKEISHESKQYQEEYRYMKESLICKYRPELLDDFQNIKFPEHVDEKALREYMKKVDECTKKAGQVPDEIFSIDFHIYEMDFQGIGKVHFQVEKNWDVLSGGYSGKKRATKKLAKISRDIYQYYGVSKEDILEKSERYASLVTVLASE